MTELQEVAAQVRVCTDCPLHRSRAIAVPGEGPENAEVFFIGEGPGYNEDRQGRPFVGAAGHFLEQMLASIGMKREQVFITNMVKCRPPDNRDPHPGEIEACGKYLDRQLELIKPKVIVTLGRHSLGRFYPGASISRVHGKARNVGDVTVCPLYHPAAALHQSSLRRTLEEDFKVIKSILESQPRAEEKREQPDPPPQQLSMF